MNILPKKRWHVRTKDNIARVRRDEAKAAAEEKAIQQRAQLAEQEARTALLRQQASKSRDITTSEIEDPSSALVTYDKHVNLFNEVEDGQKSWGINKEREAEKKEEQEKYEKNIGYLTYLGQSSLDTKGEQPWYEKAHAKRFSSDDKQSQGEVAKKVKNLLDPLKEMQKYLELSGKKNPPDVNTSTKQNAHNSRSPAVHKSHKKHKSKKKRRHKHGSSDSSSDEKSTKLEQLRAERLRREAQERKKSEKLLAKINGDNDEAGKEKQIPVRDGEQGYNSQFNPHLARKPKADQKL